jgi:hypothetical protein
VVGVKNYDAEAREWFERALVGDVGPISLAASRIVLAAAARSGQQSWGSEAERAAVALVMPGLRPALAATLLARARGARGDLLVRALLTHGSVCVGEVAHLDLGALSPGNWRDLLGSEALRGALLARLVERDDLLRPTEEEAVRAAVEAALEAGHDVDVAARAAFTRVG